METTPLYNIRHQKTLISQFKEELSILAKVLQRNKSQHGRRKYFRFSYQIFKFFQAFIEQIEIFSNSSKILSNTYDISCFNKSGNKAISYTLNTITELQLYLGNCEFVKLLAVLIAILSKLVSSVEQLLHSLKSCNEESIDKLQESNYIEDVGQIISENELRNMKKPIASMQDSFACEFKSKRQHSETKLWGSDNDYSDKISTVYENPFKKQQSVLQRISKNRVTLKRPTFKVYKQRHPLVRKVERYSRDLLRQNPPFYTYSLYL